MNPSTVKFSNFSTLKLSSMFKSFRLSLAIVCLTVFTPCFAEVNDSQHLGVQLGFNRPLLREATALANNTTLTVGMNGIRAGIVYDATIVKGFGLSLGVNYSFGNVYGKWQDGTGLTKYPQTRRQYIMQAINIPVEWQYKFLIAQDTYLILYTGPTLEYSFVFNQVNYSRKIDNEISKTVTGIYTLDSDSDGKTDYSRFQVRWGVGAGFQYQNYYLRGGYDFGIISPYADRYHDTDDYTRRGRFDCWNIRLGIYFLNF